jgi:hypothetical protein
MAIPAFTYLLHLTEGPQKISACGIVRQRTFSSLTFRFRPIAKSAG